jgi:hypothetical protein
MSKHNIRDPAPQTTAPDVTIWTVHPAFTAASDKLCALHERKDEATAEMVTLSEELDALAVFQGSDPRETSKFVAPPPPPPKSLSDEARALLGIHAPAPVAEDPKPAKPVQPVVSYADPRTRRVHELAAEVQALTEAIEIMASIREREHAVASKKLAEALNPEYGAIAERICKALVELGSAWIEQRDFMVKHCSAHAAFFRPLTLEVGNLGDPRDRNSGFRRVLTWAAETGRFDLARLPAAWMQAIPRPAPAPPKPPRKRGLVRTGIRVPIASLQAGIVPDSVD